ncbi:MAG: 50S ribosomal protein L21 [Patescibacteria group bacterium]
MSVAVIQTGGKQHLVHVGDEVIIEQLTAEPETVVDFSDILHGKTVKATVVKHDRADKIRIVKFKSKVRYLRRAGHRQQQTHIRIESIA